MSGNARLAACVAEAFGPGELRRTQSGKRRRLKSVDELAIFGAYRRGYSQTRLAKIYRVSHATISRSISRQLRQAAENQPIRAPHSGAFSTPKIQGES